MINFIEYVRNRLNKKNGLVSQKGTTIDELSVKPVSIALIDFYNKLVKERTINDVDQWEKMTEDELNSFGSKFFYTRHEGSTASTVLKIRLNSKDAIDINDNIRAFSNDGDIYKPSYTGRISSSSIRLSTDAYSLYYVMIPFVATQNGAVTNSAENTISRLENAMFSFVSVSNPLPILNGSKYETNEEYFTRLKYTLNDRSMMNKAGIYALAAEFYPSMRSIFVAGAGSRYMNRDLADASVNAEDLKTLDYRGKISGDGSVIHYAASYIFPPRPGTKIGALWGQNSSYSKYKYPMTLYPSLSSYDVDNNYDASLLGYDYTNEYTDKDYTGIFFNDYNNTTSIDTEDLLDIRNETYDTLGEDVVTPNNDWVVGANMRANGDFGEIVNDIKPDDLISFNDNVITMSGGARYGLSAGKAVGKRTGIKVTGKIKLPTSNAIYYNSNINIIVAGTDTQKVDGFNGIGMGIVIHEDFNGENSPATNAVLYITHSNKYGTSDFFMNKDDYAAANPADNAPFATSLENTNSLSEIRCNIDPNATYEFEFVLKDDLSITAMLINKAIGSTQTIKLAVPSNILSFFNDPDNGIKSLSSEYYGSTVKATLVTDVYDETVKWTITDLKAVDTNPGTPTSLFEIDVTDIDSGLDLMLRAYAKGAKDGSTVEGFTTYIWDREYNTIITNNSRDVTVGDRIDNKYVSLPGGWVPLSGISNSSGLRETSSGYLKHSLSNIGKYTVNNGSGYKIYLMVVASGASSTTYKYNDNSLGDHNATLKIDYIAARGSNDGLYHTRNKADVYAVTVKSSEEPSSVTTTVAYTNKATISAENGFIMPIHRIVSVSVEDPASTSTGVSSVGFSVYTNDEDLVGSVKESYDIVVDGSSTPSSIVVKYEPYPDIMSLHDDLNTGTHDNVYGDIIVKHKFPVDISFNIVYSGDILEGEVLSIINDYIDNNNTSKFSSRDLAGYLLSNDSISNIGEDIVVSYEKHYTDNDQITGSTLDTLYIKSIEFFYARNISVTRI